MKKVGRIMLVDDDKNTNLYNEIMLKNTEVIENIIVFQNGEEALEYLKIGDEQVNAILLDVNMPKMDGWQFLKHYENLDNSRRATDFVAMLTSSVNTDDKKKAEGFRSVKKFINKPLNERAIQAVLAMFD